MNVKSRLILEHTVGILINFAATWNFSKEADMNLDYKRFTKHLDDKYGWNDPFLLSRTLSQPDSVTSANKKKGHRPDSVSPVLHGK